MPNVYGCSRIIYDLFLDYIVIVVVGLSVEEVVGCRVEGISVV